ncbi:MAG TPA: ATP-dependent DNA helicase RecG [Burkholderiaceae bacterium]|nr:ATP-dependent DNA helicase RecG [Burkholderiaceae bacterium]
MPIANQKPSNRAPRSPPAASPGTSRAGRIAHKLTALGLHTDIDLALHLPLRYEDETQIVPLTAALQSAGRIGGSALQVEGVVSACEIQYRPRRQLVVTLADEDECAAGDVQLTLRFLNFYGSQVKQLAIGHRVRARGEIRIGFFGAEMVHPTYKIVQRDTPLSTGLTPVYPAGDGLPQAYLRKAIAAALARVDWHDTLPPERLAALQLAPFEQSVRLLHNPPPEVDQVALQERTHPAWTRMKFDELLAQQLSLKRAQQARRTRNAAALPLVGPLCAALQARLPFTLTAAQQRVLGEIRTDLGQSYPMQRLLQGDVGSGKTVVAALAAAQAIDNGFQAALMAPTEILADQHFRKIASWIEPLGVTVAWLTGSLKKKEKSTARAAIEAGTAQLVIGTHALIQDDVHFPKLGLVIVDEQHRFGVGQRLALRNKGLPHDDLLRLPHSKNMVPHQLMMSATPIPRTLAMTYYADLEISVIDQLPPGRTPVLTRAIDQNRREEVIARVHAAALEGRQVYWVCPLIEESEVLQLQTATETHAMLSAALPDLRVGLVHGRLKPAEKQQVMEAFTRAEIQLLVATTVIEVGVDVPNASLMVIEHAERFGLSQLHQLRGRVGRGSTASVCLLLYQSPLGAVARQRLLTMRVTADGFEIARRDLALRGPGEFLGARQSGQAMLRFADLERDQWLVERARDLAQELLETEPATVRAHLARWLGQREEFLKV